MFLIFFAHLSLTKSKIMIILLVLDACLFLRRLFIQDPLKVHVAAPIETESDVEFSQGGRFCLMGRATFANLSNAFVYQISFHMPGNLAVVMERDVGMLFLMNHK